jgi:hypothetical protein
LCTCKSQLSVVEDDARRIGLAPERLDEAISVCDQLQHPNFDDEHFGWADILSPGSLVVERTAGDHFSAMAPWNIGGAMANTVTHHLTSFLSQDATTAAHN